MKKLYKDVISIIKCALHQNEGEVDSVGFDWDAILCLVEEHKIQMMMYYGLLQGDFSVSNEVFENIKKNAFAEMAFSMRQQFEMEDLFKIFEEAKIEFLPLKGAVMKEMYPKPDMRLMSDTDILIKGSQYKAISALMVKHGYSFSLESDHEYVWTKDGGVLCVELHKSLVPSYNKDFYGYYGDGWRVATRKNGMHYYMSDEDFFVYMFTHFAKHYRDSGIGLKHIIDIWICLKNDKMDYRYIEDELKKLSLYEFYRNVRKTLEVWFNDGEESSETDIITRWIFTSGVYGTTDKTALSKALRRTGGKEPRYKSYFRILFPKYKIMSEKHKVLQKAPILLPFAWVWRIVFGVFFRRNSIKVMRDGIAFQNEKNIEAYKSILNKVGLDM